MINQINIPDSQIPHSKESLWLWYRNIPKELALDFLTEEDKQILSTYYQEAGLLRNWRRPYFRAHFSDTFSRAAEYLLAGKDSPTIIDIGSGYGTQAIYFALHGARVISVDLDTEALRIQEKRIQFYQKLSQKSLNIDLIEGDCLELDYGDFGPLDGFYSMFAFNMIQPSKSVLDAILPYMNQGGRFVIQDGNSSSAVKYIIPSRRRDVFSPDELRRHLLDWNFEISDHQGCIVFPPLIWLILPNWLLDHLETPLRKNWFFPLSHQIMAIKSG